jgi:NitT/TauT family transport system permease protein
MAHRPAALSRIRRSRLPGILIALPVPILLIVIWDLISISGLLPKAFLPDPPTVFAALVDWMFGGILVPAQTVAYSGTWLVSLIGSSERVLGGYVIGAFLGVIGGGLLGYFPLLRRAVEPTINLLRAVPIIGWLPLALVFFGIEIQSALFLVGLGTFFPVLVSTMGGIRSVSESLVRVGHMVGASPAQQLRYIVVPSALPHIITGLRVAMGFSWILVIVAEWVAVKNGLGFVLLDAYNFFRYDYVIAAMISVGFMGLISDRLIWWLSRPALRWWAETTLDR